MSPTALSNEEQGEKPDFWRDNVNFNETEELQNLVRAQRKVVIMPPAMEIEVQELANNGTIGKTIDKRLKEVSLTNKEQVK